MIFFHNFNFLTLFMNSSNKMKINKMKGAIILKIIRISKTTLTKMTYDKATEVSFKALHVYL